MKTISTRFSRIAQDVFLRCDEKYHLVDSANSFNVFSVPVEEQILLGDIIYEDYIKFEYEDGVEYKGIPTGQTYIDEDGDIIDYQVVTLDDHPDRLKYKISNKHILLSSLRLAKSPALLFDNIKLSDYVFSNGFYSFLVKPGWNRKFVLYLLRSKTIKSLIDNNIYRGIGISAYKVRDLLRIPIRNISLSDQELVVAKIKPYEDKIANLKKEKVSAQEIIDTVFKREFAFDYARFEQLKSYKHFFADQANFSNNPDLRFSAKFHRPAGEFVMRQLTQKSDKKLKHFLAEPIVTGAGVSPNDYDESGQYFYISMASIKNWLFDPESASTVSVEYFKDNIIKTVRVNDIILARSGEGTIGKVAIVTDPEIEGVFADFTMRIRLNENKYNPMFAYYYMRTCYFQYLIEVYKKGLGNNTNIFPIVIKEFPVPNISLSEQQRIVDEISKEMHKQESIKKEIADLRQEIDDMIDEAIMLKNNDFSFIR